LSEMQAKHPITYNSSKEDAFTVAWNRGSFGG
jgi:hypothetical protein